MLRNLLLIFHNFFNEVSFFVTLTRLTFLHRTNENLCVLSKHIPFSRKDHHGLTLNTIYKHLCAFENLGSFVIASSTHQSHSVFSKVFQTDVSCTQKTERQPRHIYIFYVIQNKVSQSS